MNPDDAKTPPTWRTFQVPIDRLREPPGPNPNVMSPGDLTLLAANIRETGCVQPILARTLPGNAPPPPPYADPLRPTEDELLAEATWLLSDEPLEVIDGSHRGLASREAGLTTVPVTVVVASDERAVALRIGMNKLRGDLDLSAVGRILDDLAADGLLAPVADLTGFPPDEIADLLAAVRPIDAEAAAMEALSSAPDEDTEPPEDRPTRYHLDIAFDSRASRDAARRALKEAAGGDLAVGLSKILVDAGLATAPGSE
jgi:ParB-like chromosome segregation protein Spo0J